MMNDSSYTIYIKVDQNIEIRTNKVLLKDITKVFCADEKIVNELNEMLVLVIETQKDCKFIFSILKIIELISKIYPTRQVISLGESNFIIDYKIQKKNNVIIEYLKTILVALSIFVGAAFTIMTFNTDVSVEKVFDNIYELMMGEAKKGPSLLELSYSIGLPLGIIVFFNHFSKVRIDKDPTPITIQMRLFEDDVNKTFIINSNREGKTIDID